MLAQVQAASAGNKNIREDFPYGLPWDDKGEDKRTEREKETELEAAIPMLTELMKQNIK